MKAINAPLTLRELAELSLIAALMEGSKLVMAPLPNIKILAVLIIITVIFYGAKAFYPVYVFVLIEGFIYGFGLWFICYLYVWDVLVVVALLFRKNESALIWAVIAGLFGLSFGAFCTIPYFFIGGPAMALSYWVSGIPFDLIHSVSNFVLTLLLINPLKKLFVQLRSAK